MENKASDLKVSLIILYKDLFNYVKNHIGLEIKNKSNNYYIKRNNIPDRFREYVDYFRNILEKNFRKELLNNYYQNIDSVNIYGLLFQLGDVVDVDKYAGVYNINRNDIKINIGKESSLADIFHELFHLASAKSVSNGKIAGFYYHKKNGKETMNTLNEGYTDLLTMRYFGNVGYLPAYDNEMIFAGLLEKIIGKEKMEKMYLRADPKSLLDEMMKYGSLEDLSLFIRDFDSINEEEARQLKKQKLDSMFIYLIKGFYTKQIIEKGNSNDSIIFQEMINYLNQIPKELNINGYNYKMDYERLFNEAMELYSYQNSQTYMTK